MIIAFIFIAIWIALLIIANLWIWIRPKFANTLIHSFFATLLALALFLSCFIFGIWIGILKLNGELGVLL